MTPIFGCDRRAQKYCETRCFLGVVLHVLSMEGQESMATTVSCKQHRNTTAFIKKKNKNITETTATTTGTAIALGWNSPTRHMFFVSHMCAWKDLTWSSRPDTCEPHCLRIDSTWGIWKKVPHHLKICTQSFPQWLRWVLLQGPSTFKACCIWGQDNVNQKSLG